ncbi:MAG TPA: TRAP transporter substrate-binding protein [Candidatus Dorea intestinavium]|nr:TRAP transporter substrate-binding protein [Candidatus Dorea intestinavium]
MKKGFSAMLAIVMTLTLMLSGCGEGNQTKTKKSANTQPKIVLKAGELSPDDNINTEVMQYFCDEVKKLSDGEMEVELYSGGQLGDERTEIQAVQMGALDAFRANTLTMGDFGVKEMNVFGLPYLFQGREHLWKALKSETGREILKGLEKNKTSMIGLGFVDEGSRNFFAKKEIKSPEDLKGMKMRVAETSILMDTVKCFGASPTPISMSELYTSLQTGVVDGADQPLAGYISNSFFEVNNNLVLDGHTYSPGIIIFSEYKWNRLNKEEQGILKKAASNAEDYNKKIIEKDDQDQIEQLKEKKVNVVEITDFTPWQDAVKPVYEKYGKGYMHLVEEIQEMK